MKTKSSKTLILVVLLVVFFLNYPWLSLFSESRLIAGFPVFYLYLFTTWFIFIMAIWMLTEKRKDPKPEISEEPNDEA